MNQKPTIVMLPGMDGTGEFFRWFVPEIESFARSSMITYPNNSFLNYGELADYVTERLPAENFVLLAESFSGPVASIVAARNPTGLIGVVFVASFIASPVPRWWRKLPLQMLFQLRPPKLLLRWLLLDKTCRPEVVTEVAKTIATVPPFILASRLKEILKFDASDMLRAITVPIVSISAESDRLIGIHGDATFRRARPDIEFINIEGPHLLTQSRPQAVAEIIKRYIDQWSIP